MQNLMPPIGTPDNLFHDGNPLTGEQGTIVTAAHLNNVQGATRDIQTELLAVLADAKIEVNPEDHAQLLKALKAVIGTFGAGKFLSISKNLKEIADAGQASIDAVLQNLKLGSAAKANVGNGVGQLPSMTFFGYSIPNTRTAGYHKLPSGLMLQWMYIDVPKHISTSIPSTIDAYFTIPFTTICYGVMPFYQGYSASPSGMAFLSGAPLTLSSYRVANSYSGSELQCFVLAIGY